MTAAPGAERLAIARAEVNRACNLLIAPTPDALNGCQDALERAVSALRDFRSGRLEVDADPGDGAGDRASVQSLRAEVMRASRLLQNLARFYRGWERILGTMSGGYTASGNPAPVARQGRIYCRV
jgi:hypothetical protein